MLVLVKKIETPQDSYDARLEELFGNASIRRGNAAFGQGNDLHVTFTMDASEWKVLKRMGHLGGLYGVDLSNYLSRKGLLKSYIVPSVDDSRRASKGLKRISVSYYASRS